MVACACNGAKCNQTAITRAKINFNFHDGFVADAPTYELRRFGNECCTKVPWPNGTGRKNHFGENVMQSSQQLIINAKIFSNVQNRFESGFERRVSVVSKYEANLIEYMVFRFHLDESFVQTTKLVQKGTFFQTSTVGTGNIIPTSLNSIKVHGNTKSTPWFALAAHQKMKLKLWTTCFFFFLKIEKKLERLKKKTVSFSSDKKERPHHSQLPIEFDTLSEE